MNDENINRVLLNKILNILKKDITFEDGKMVFNIYDDRQGKLTINKASGINIVLKNGGYVNDYLVGYLTYQYGLNKEECEILWREISLYLKKENYVYHLGPVLYEDYIEYQEDPYRVEGYRGEIYNIRNYNSFKKFVNYHVHNFHDPHNDERVDYLSMMDEEDYMGVYNYIMNIIEQNL
jgi:hypothetical protein